MDKVILASKLESLRRCVARVEQKTPVSAGALKSDADAQDILTLNLARSVQLCVDIGSHLVSASEQTVPTTMAGVFGALVEMEVISGKTADAMRRAVGFRNIAVHNYEAINWDIVYSISTKSLADFKQFAREIAAYSVL